MLLDRPGRIPGRSPVPAEVGRDEVETIGEAVGDEVREAGAVRRDAVHADHGRGFRIAPFAHMEGRGRLVKGIDLHLPRR